VKLTPTDLPNEIVSGKTAYQQTVEEFLESGERVAVVDELSVKPPTARARFAEAIKSMGIESVRARLLKGHLYLVRR
jgi:hypothetical protein